MGQNERQCSSLESHSTGIIARRNPAHGSRFTVDVNQRVKHAHTRWVILAPVSVPLVPIAGANIDTQTHN